MCKHIPAKACARFSLPVGWAQEGLTTSLWEIRTFSNKNEVTCVLCRSPCKHFKCSMSWLISILILSLFYFLFYFNLCCSGVTSTCGALLEMIWVEENSKGSMHQLMDLPPACTPSSLHPPCNPSVWNNHTALQDRLGSRRSASCLGSAFGCWVVAGAKDVPGTQILCSARGSLAEQQNYYWYIYFWSGYLFFNWSELNYSQTCPCYSWNWWYFP